LFATSITASLSRHPRSVSNTRHHGRLLEPAVVFWPPAEKGGGGPTRIDWYAIGVLAADAAGVIVIDLWLDGGTTITVTLGGGGDAGAD
jgi:hypothetical protein